MSLFLKILERFTGRKSQRPAMDASGSGDLGELKGLGWRTRRTFRHKVKMEPPGKKLKSLMVEDIDPKTGRAYPDHEERRKKKKEAGSSKEAPAGCPGDVSPD